MLKRIIKTISFIKKKSMSLMCCPQVEPVPEEVRPDVCAARPGQEGQGGLQARQDQHLQEVPGLVVLWFDPIHRREEVKEDKHTGTRCPTHSLHLPNLLIHLLFNHLLFSSSSSTSRPPPPPPSPCTSPPTLPSSSSAIFASSSSSPLKVPEGFLHLHDRAVLALDPLQLRRLLPGILARLRRYLVRLPLLKFFSFF